MKEHKGMGFKAAEESVQKKEGYTEQEAAALIAVGARHASAASKRSNQNLKHVKG